MFTSPKIAIIGAGPAGLCLSIILRKNGIPCTIYEQETSSTTRSQGGTLDLHPQTGQAAVKKAGLFEEFEKHARREGEAFALADRDGRRYINRQDAEETGRPEIDRVKLRQILLDSLPEGTIKWGSNLKSADLNNGKGTLHFADHTEEGFDLIVGADGAWSKIRPLVTSFKPFYSSISAFFLCISDIDNRYPKLGKMIGRGSYFAFGEEEQQALLCQRNGDGCVRIYAGGKRAEEWVSQLGLDKKPPQELRESMLEDFSTWGDDLKELIRVCDDDIWARPMYMMPPGARWANMPGATLIGDAAHLMTPFAGEGVNIALTDEMALADAIIANKDMIEATKEYENKMFAYAERATSKTFRNLLDRFEPGGIQKFVDMVNRRVEQMKLEEKEKT